MPEERILVRVSAEELPLRTRALIDPSRPRPAESRFLVRRAHARWIPAAWLAGLLAIGIVCLRSTITAGLDRQAGAERIVYGTLAAVCLVGAAFAAGTLVQGLAERRAIRRGRYRQGLHVLGREGLLIAGRGSHTWVPKGLMPAPMEISGPASGAGHSPSYAFILVDERDRMERLDCGITTKNALSLWAEHGQLPEGGGWR
jgi:hypothetical protein